MKIGIRLRVSKDDEVFLGKGVRILLAAIDECNSIRQATIRTGISYPKALRMIKTLHSSLNFEVVSSSKGGVEHGSTILTERGKALLEAYTAMEKQIEEYAAEKMKGMLLPIINEEE